ncbi:MAG: hypothetical protein KDJ17_03110, partial [Hyphomicrobiaceae bacterium]|nr:hypothetical protein [Hyphomicrobiaceae bacterium]
RSLSAKFSKPLDCAILVRSCKYLILRSFSDVQPLHFSHCVLLSANDWQPTAPLIGQEIFVLWVRR